MRSIRAGGHLTTSDGDVVCGLAAPCGKQERASPHPPIPAAIRVPSVHTGRFPGMLPMFMGDMRNSLEFQTRISGFDLNPTPASGFM